MGTAMRGKVGTPFKLLIRRHGLFQRFESFFFGDLQESRWSANPS